MPSSWPTVPHYRQVHEYSCVGACVRMVLAHYGDVRSEADLRALLDTRPTGTRAGNVMRLSDSTYEVYLRPSNLAELQRALAKEEPLIVLLKTGPLEYWTEDVFHAAVLIGLDAVAVAINEPYFASAPQTTSLPSFEKAWAQTGQFTAFLRPRRQPPGEKVPS